jgi:hypothetical protein
MTPDEREHEENIVEALAMFIEFCNTSEGAVVERAKASAHHLADAVASLRGRVEQAEREANEYRVEADRGLSDYDALELEAGIMREALEKIAAKRPNKGFDPWAVEVATEALGATPIAAESSPDAALQLRVEQAEKALADIIAAAEPREWETPGHPMNEWTRREPILSIARAVLPEAVDAS